MKGSEKAKGYLDTVRSEASSGKGACIALISTAACAGKSYDSFSLLHA